MSSKTWNHRIISKVEGGQQVLAIHEVHYHDLRPVSYMDEPTAAEGVDMTEMCGMLASMQDALSLPIMAMSDFTRQTVLAEA